MTTRLASLRAEASLDAAKYKAGADQVDAANKKMAASQGAANTKLQQTQVRTSESARAFDRYRQSLDPVFRAQQQVEAGARRVDQALAKGQITALDHARLMTSLQQRYAGAGSEASRLASSVGGLYGAFGNLRAVLAGVGVLMAAREYFQFADTMTNIASKLRLVTSSSAELNTVQEKLLALSNATRSGFESTVQLYSRVARNADQLGLSQQKVIDLTETVQQAIRVSGTTSSEAASGVIQFSQALASGRLSGDEFRSVMENMPRLARALSDGLGVTIGDLRALANDQKLTSDVVVKALQSQAGAIRAEFGQLPATVSESFTVLNNNMLAFVGKVDQASAASKDLGGTIRSLADVLKDPETIQAGVTIVKSLAAAFDFVGKSVVGAMLLVNRFFSVSAEATRAQLDQAISAAKVYGSVVFQGKSVGLGQLQDLKRKFELDQELAAIAARRPISSRQSVSVAAGKEIQGLMDDERVAGVAAAKRKEAELLTERKRQAEAGAKSDAARAVSLAKYIDGLEDEVRLTKLTTLERAKEEAVLRAMEISGGKLSAIDAGRVRNAVTLREAAEQQAKAAEDAAERQKEAIAEASRKAEEFNDDVRSEVDGALRSLFDGGVDGWRTMLERWQSLLFDWVSRIGSSIDFGSLFQGSSGGGGLSGANFGGAGGGSGLGNLGSIGGVNVGGALGAAGIAYAVYQGGSSLAQSLAGLSGRSLSAASVARTGQVGGLIGGLPGGIFGSVFGSKPSNATARLDFDAAGVSSLVPFSKMTAETKGAIYNASAQIQTGVGALEAVGATLTDRISSIAIGVRDESHIDFASGTKLRSAVGDPNALALTAIKRLAATASFADADVASVARRDYASSEELLAALTFTKDIYTVIANAERPLSQVQGEMKALTEGFKSARKEAERLGLSLDKFDAGARKTFDQAIGDQIKGILDPVGLALDQFERDAASRVGVAKQLGADLVQVERLNGLQRAQVLAQAASASVDGLKSLIDDISFGGLSAASPDQQYFSVLSRFNVARRDALDNRTPEAIGEFESVSRALLPIARSFLGTSTNFANLQSTVVATARELGGSASDPAAIGQAIVAATANGSAQVVDAIQTMQRQIDDLIAENKRLNATLIATLNRAA